MTVQVSKKRGAYGPRKKTYYWDYETRVNAEQYIERLCGILEDPLGSMEQNNGDILITELNQLLSGLFHIRNRNDKRG
tara:strand:- start:238 stop:471 length:234 start_codon:yes stop_codon:yes gene_type:complete